MPKARVILAQRRKFCNKGPPKQDRIQPKCFQRYLAHPRKIRNRTLAKVYRKQKGTACDRRLEGPRLKGYGRQGYGSPEGSTVAESTEHDGGPVVDRGLRSRAALLARFPDLGPILAQPLTVSPVISDGVVVDMALGGGRFYGGDGRETAARQIAQAMAEPVRFRPDFVNANPTVGMVEQRILAALRDESQRLGLVDESFVADPDPNHGYLVVLGLGLGHHLAPLIAQTRSRHVLVVESEPEFLRQSLGAIDWAEILDGVEAGGGVLRVYLGTAAEPILTALRKAFGNIGIPYVDGCWWFQHYANPVLDEVARRLGEAARLAFIARGYYEDERLMISNAAANLERQRFRLIDNRPRPPRPEPAIIIGSGPSVDGALPHLKRLTSEAVVFTCGTGLGVCRRHGITPDFHCESENNDHSYRVLSTLAQKDSLAGITLVCSVTVDPRMPLLFDNTFFCFRELSISTRLLADPDQEIAFAAPIVGNLALRMAVALGFRTVYLFGLDCGSRIAECRHAAGSAYETDAVLRQSEHDSRFDMAVPGNFGGTVMTDLVFNWSRTMFGAFIASQRTLTVYNCGDGARIEHATPLAPSAVRFARPRLDRQRVLAEIGASLVEFAPGTFLQGRSLAPARQDADRFFNDLDAALAAAAAEDADVFGIWRRLAPFAEERPDGYGGATSIALGSIRYLIKAGAYILRRVADAHLRRSLKRRYLDECRAIVADLRLGTLELLDGLGSAPETPAE